MRRTTIYVAWTAGFITSVAVSSVTRHWPLGRALAAAFLAGAAAALLVAALLEVLAAHRPPIKVIDWRNRRAVHILEDLDDPETFWHMVRTWTTEPSTPSA